MRVFAIAGIALASVIAIFTIESAEFSGHVEHVTDGDTFRMSGQRIRLWGIDAPELRTPDGPTARNKLSTLILNQRVSCVAQHEDRYRRTVAKCRLGDQDIGAYMVGTGWARDWPAYSNGTYADAEAEARLHRLGIWR